MFEKFKSLDDRISTSEQLQFINVKSMSKSALKQRWFWVDSKNLLSLTIIQCLRTVTLNDICSDLICLRTVVFSWYFMKVSRKWSEEASIFSKLQVYENIHESFSFSITLKDVSLSWVSIKLSLLSSPHSWKLWPYCL